ncbi:Dienelactone hydrolase [Prosthecobacter debontii]|uniref:Dienelactone hydrolase n=1 Tax=Prosthecobacter debontii TaxID=48467 RepID=A0A1T4YQU7_9BACT|nr:dienelactone hydrolase family protein [Prosthecobacter debontii]SKB04217.1 Dienelactone hydrolase [Prosthecobacter debontii]
MKRALFAACLFATSLASAAIVEKAVEYKAGDVQCEGWQAYDDASDAKRPSVLIVHQWTGVSDNEKMRARMLAELGYNVFVADVYGKGIRPQPPESGKEAGKYKSNRPLLRERVKAGLAVLSKDARTDTAKIACIGYCFGGTAAIELGRSGAPVKGIVSFHGGLDSPTPADGKKIKGKVLALHGADDPFVPAKDLAAFEQEMKDSGVDYKLVQYPGAVHSFTQVSAGNDNSKGAAYNEAADKASWEEMKAFFKRIFAD